MPTARRARGQRHRQRQRRRHRRPRPAAHLRAVLSRRRRHGAADPRQRPRPEPGQADHGRARRPRSRCAPTPARAARSRCTCRSRRKARWPADRRSGRPTRPASATRACRPDACARALAAKLGPRAPPDLRHTRAVARILIVEDEPGLVLTLSDRLGREGHVVEAATDGREGLARASQEPFDLLLLDVMLPGLGGFDMLRDLRQQGVETPVIMLTARGQVIDKVLGLKLGADDYLTKPFEMMELLARDRGAAAPRRAEGHRRCRGLPFRRDPGRFPQGRSHPGRRRRRAVGARVPAAALLHRAPRRDDLTRRAAQSRVGLSRHAEHAHGGRPRRVAAAEDRTQPQASAVRHHCARLGLQVRGLGRRARAANSQGPTSSIRGRQLPNRTSRALGVEIGSALGVGSWTLGVGTTRAAARVVPVTAARACRARCR